MIIESICGFVLCFLMTFGILKKLIPILKSKKMGQKILDIGPRWHASKEGTPTLGGLSFIAAFTILYIAFVVYELVSGIKINIAVLATVIFALLNGCIGFIDDRKKLLKKQNEGLTAKQKYLLQLAVTIIYIVVLRVTNSVSTLIPIPFFNTVVDLGVIWYPFMVILITGIVNSVNLADGIDGLAAGETSAVAIFFIAVSILSASGDSLFVSALLLSSTLGFLTYNFHPARVFMGDTGSLFLGAWVIGLSIICGSPLWSLIVGFMYVLESISDILQVSYFKLTHGKRIFKMAPIHHHFEKCGWSEIKIFTVFTTITFILGVVTFIFDLII